MNQVFDLEEKINYLLKNSSTKRQTEKPSDYENVS